MIRATLAYAQRTSRYEGQLTAKRIEREYPHLVDVPIPEVA